MRALFLLLVFGISACGTLRGPLVDLFSSDAAAREDLPEDRATETAERTADDAERRETPTRREEATTRRDAFGDPLPPGAVARLGTVRFRAAAYAYDVLISPDGAALVSGHEDGLIRFFEKESGALIRSVSAHEGGVRDMAFAGGGRLFSVGWDGRAVEWTARGERVKTLVEEDAALVSLAVSGDGGLIAYGRVDGRVELSGKAVTLEPAGGRVDGLAFSPDGGRLAAASWDKTVRLYDLAKGGAPKTLPEADAVYAVAFSEDGRWLASGGRSARITVWDAGTGRRVRRWRAHGAGVTSLRFVGDDILSTGADGSVARFDAKTGKTLFSTSIPSARELRSIAVVGDRIAVGGAAGTIRFFGLGDGVEVHPIEGAPPVEVTAIAFSSDGLSVVTGSAEGRLRVYDAQTGAHERTFGEGGPEILDVAFTEDGGVVSVDAEGNLRRFDRKSGRKIKERRVGRDVAFGVFSKDADKLALYTGKALRTEALFPRKVLDRARVSGQPVAYAAGAFLVADGRKVSVGKRSFDVRNDVVGGDLFKGEQVALLLRSNSDQQEIIFGAAGEEKRSVVVPVHQASKLRFSPDGAMIVVAGAYRHVRKSVVRGNGEWELLEAPAPEAVTPKLITLASGRMRPLKGHDGGARSVAFSPDGARVATGGVDSTVLIWDVR